MAGLQVFVKISSFFTQQELKKLSVNTLIETRQAGPIWELEEIPNDWSAWRSLVLWHLTLNNYSHRTFKDKIFSAFGLVITATWKSNIQMGSISSVSFCHLKMLSLFLESKMLHQKSGRQHWNGDVQAMCSKLTTAFKTVRWRILKNNSQTVQETPGKVRVA